MAVAMSVIVHILFIIEQYMYNLQQWNIMYIAYYQVFIW